MTDDTAQSGLFVSLEGPDGAGKSSQALRLVASLRARGLEVVDVREPGGTRLGEEIRGLLLESAEGVTREPLADALLFVAARAQLVAEVIRPALTAGRLVICDRFVDSTLAYQGYGAGLDVDWLRALNARATGGLVPDMTILLDLEPGVGLARRESGPLEERTRFERSTEHDRDFHARVREGYRRLALADPDRWRTVDAAGDADSVAAQILGHVDDLLRSTSAGTGDEPISAPVRMNP
jgi:dTMP kinase